MVAQLKIKGSFCLLGLTKAMDSPKGSISNCKTHEKRLNAAQVPTVTM